MLLYQYYGKHIKLYSNSYIRDSIWAIENVIWGIKLYYT